MLTSGEWLYRDAHYLVADVEIDPAAARRWIPRPLRPTKPAMASIFTAWFPHSPFGSVYREAGILLHVEHLFTRAVYCPWMMVDDDVALILGRELLGYPKKLGSVTLERTGDTIDTVASRRGSDLIRMHAELGEIVANPPPMLGRPHRNVRASLGAAIPWLLAFTPRERAIEVRRATMTLEVLGSPRDPLAELAPSRPLAAYLHRVDLAAGSPPLPIGIASPIAHLRNLLIRVQ